MSIVSNYEFALIVPSETLTHEEILDATDALGAVDCDDASTGGHADGMELLFERSADTLQAAITSAISDVERAGFRVSKIELQREAIPG